MIGSASNWSSMERRATRTGSILGGRRALHSLVSGSLCLWLALRPAPASGTSPRPVSLPIAFHVVHVAGQPVVARDFLDGQLERADEIFGRYGVRFVASTTLELAEAHAALETRADRDTLAAHVSPGVINCFVVRSLRDVDEPSRLRRGVHWHSQSHPGAHFVILSSIAGPTVLAHELGHFLGNPRHSQQPGNLMSYTRSTELPVLDAGQLRRMRAAIDGYRSRGELDVR
jgi:hypothetical protein